MTDQPAIWRTNSITFLPETTYEEWFEEWLKIDATDKLIQWAIGDALVTGSDRFPEQWSQAVDEQYAEKHRAKMWVSRAIPPGERRDGFSWSFHRELARLDRAERDAWFDRASAGGWNTVERLKQEMAPPSSRSQDAARPGMPSARVPAIGLAEDDIPEALWPEDVVAAESGSQSNTNPMLAELRSLIEDVREFQTEGGGTNATIVALENLGVGYPLVELGDALEMKPQDWRLTITEQEDQTWEVRLRKDGQRFCIAIGPNLCPALVECALAARIRDLL